MIGRRALIVDDNLPLAQDLGEILESEGYHVHVYDDPQRVAEDASELEFDVALLDVRMPGIDGVTLHGLLRERHPEARFILMTAYAEDERLARALESGARAVLTKPVPLSALFEALAAGESHNLLVVDQEGPWRRALCQILADSGYTCRCASCTAEAFEQLRDQQNAQAVASPPWTALVITLPDTEAEQATSALALSQAAGAPAVLITSRVPSDCPQEVKGELARRTRIITKPFAPEALLRALHELKESAP